MSLTITDTPPIEIQNELNVLRENLDNMIPAKILDRNILIGTWNIRSFGRVTKKWKSQGSDSPKRDFYSVQCIAEIISRFDVVAIQEVTSSIQGLRYVMKLLGDHWNFILTDVTKGDKGNNERMAFVFDTRKVNISGLAAELVVPFEKGQVIAEGALDRQFDRTPYAVSFKSGSKTFILVTLHIRYGKNQADRISEIKEIARWIKEWANNVHSFSQNLIVLGDFNIDKTGDILYDTFVSEGLHVPDDLQYQSRTIFKETKHYDQIAWFQDSNHAPVLSLNYQQGNIYDFKGFVFLNDNLSNNSLSWRLSDHLPMWAEFNI